MTSDCVRPSYVAVNVTSAGAETPLLVTVRGNEPLVLPLAMVTADGTISAFRSAPSVCSAITAPFAGAGPPSITVPVAVSLRWSTAPPAPDGPTTVSDCSPAPEGLVGVPLHAAIQPHVAIVAAQRR
jgi:hypothetical protein